MILCNQQILLGSFAVLLLLSGCYGADSEVKSIPFETIEQGGNSGVRTGKTLAIYDEAAWKGLWAEHKKGSSPGATPPEVDFSKQMVVAIFLGERRTGGYFVTVKSISADSGGLTVGYEENRPGRGCIVTMALTYPFQIIRLARVEGPVTFNPVSRATDCSGR